VDGAQRKHDVDQETAERVFAMVKGFSGFGFPKAHGAAFGLLAYQSTWLRVHYTPELLCSLLNEQPMGFYPPDALVHEAQRRGIEVLAPDVNDSGVECDVELPDRRRQRPAGLGDGIEARDGPPQRVRIGLGYVKGVRADEVAALVAAREAAGRFRNLSDLASRAGPGASSLELLAWSGACDSLAGGNGSARRTALWQLGVMTPGRRVPGGTQLALPLDLPAPPRLRDLSSWEEMLADYSTTGLTVGEHPLALLRERLPADVVTSRDLESLQHGMRVRIGGLVVARQRPGTASGIVFLLLEDEYGTINLIVPPAVYERHRLTVRTEPLMLAEGKLEKLPAAGGAINVLVTKVGSIDAPDHVMAEIKDFSMLDEQVRRGLAEQRAAAANGGEQEARPDGEEQAAVAAGGGEVEDFRAVAPPVMSFASGRRR
jgi:error-prone DNA polymerase